VLGAESRQGLLMLIICLPGSNGFLAKKFARGINIEASNDSCSPAALFLRSFVKVTQASLQPGEQEIPGDQFRGDRCNLPGMSEPSPLSTTIYQLRDAIGDLDELREAVDRVKG
jgi:hypothetical protein